MTCLICNEPAVAIDADDEYLERACPKCGHYRVTGAALVLMKVRGCRFDVELTRKWIAEHQGSGSIPTIDSHQVAPLIHV
jgi:DNA-directed RNA polymerase subunit RPC12/RpoP